MVYNGQGKAVRYTTESYVCCARIPCSGRYSQSYCRDSFKRQPGDEGIDVEQDVACESLTLLEMNSTDELSDSDLCGYGYSCWIKPGQPSPNDHHADSEGTSSGELHADAGIFNTQADITNPPGDGISPDAVADVAAIEPGLSPDGGEAESDPNTDPDAFSIDDAV